MYILVWRLHLKPDIGQQDVLKHWEQPRTCNEQREPGHMPVSSYHIHIASATWTWKQGACGFVFKSIFLALQVELEFVPLPAVSLQYMYDYKSKTCQFKLKSNAQSRSNKNIFHWHPMLGYWWMVRLQFLFMHATVSLFIHTLPQIRSPSQSLFLIIHSRCSTSALVM
jgi:hypothetical protein